MDGLDGLDKLGEALERRLNESPSSPAETPSTTGGTSSLEGLGAALDKKIATLGTDPKKAERKAKREAKQEELRAGGKRAAEKDWVQRYAEGRISRTTRVQADVQIKVRGESVPNQPKFRKLSVKERKELKAELEGTKNVQPSVPPPKPVAERTVEELYTLLLSTWTRYKVVLTKDDGQPRVALNNVQQVHDLLVGKGESPDDVITFLKGHMEGGE